MHSIEKSNKLDNVCYDIRGPVLKQAQKLEDEGQRILKLNIGNPAPFGFEAPEEDVNASIHTAYVSQFEYVKKSNGPRMYYVKYDLPSLLCFSLAAPFKIMLTCCIHLYPII